MPEPVLAFYRDYEPTDVIENGQVVRLHPIASLLDENAEMIPGCHTAQHGYVVFATNLCGDAYAFDLNCCSSSLEPRIVLLSHEMICEDTAPDEIARLAKPVAANLAEFLDQFLLGEVDEECAEID